MEVYRISRIKYSTSLKSSGCSNRWNLDGEFVIYAAGNRSLATVELVVHKNAIAVSGGYKIMVISIADEEHLFSEVDLKKLSALWRKESSYPETQLIGSKWYNSNSSLVLKVPSAVVQHEFNYVINTRHPEFYSKVKLVQLEDYFWDERLFK